MNVALRVSSFLVCGGLAGCGTPRPVEPWKEAGASLDRVAGYLAEWGSVTVSDVFLVENDGQFSQDYAQTVAQYVQAARTGHGASVRSAKESAESSQASLRLSADLEALLATFGVVLPGVTDPAPAHPVTPGDHPRAADAFAQPKLDPILALGSLPAEISERRAMISGFDDKVTEQVLKFLLNPTEVRGKTVYFGVLEVNCVPGWRTREGYAADLCLTSFFAEVDSHGGKTSSRGDFRARQPFVLAAFPFSEAQTIDQRRSLRDHVERARLFAAALSFRGLAAEAESFRSFADRLQNDAASRTQLPVITTYSAGNAFGYHIRPSFRALADLADPASRSGNRLDPLAFPALVMVVADSDQVAPAGKYTHIELLASARWLPLSPGRAHEGESLRLSVVNDLSRVRGLFPRDASAASELNSEVERRYQLLSNFARGETRYTLLPKAAPTSSPSTPQPPTLTAVEPPTGFDDGPTTLVITGAHFGIASATLVKRVTVGGIVCEFTPISESTLIAVVPSRSFPDSQAAQPLTVVTTGGVATLPNAVSFTMNAPDAPMEPFGIVIDRNAQGAITGVRVRGSSPASDTVLIETIRAAMPQLPSGVRVEVSATGSAGDAKP